MKNLIPLVDLYAQYIKYKEEFDDAIAQCIRSSSFIGGNDWDAFREEFADFCGGGYVALCGNGTDALYLAIMEILGPGDGLCEVITVSFTFAATAEAIILAGYIPVFIDIDPSTYLMDTSLIEEAIKPITKAILPVHLYGQMVPMDELAAIASKYNIPLIEDAAQAHGSTWKGNGPGYWGQAACFSFYPSKNLGAWGDAGAIFTQDKDLANRIQMRANHGRKSKYEHNFVGTNSRLDGIQAAILRVKLRHLKEWNETRVRIASLYSEALRDLRAIVLPLKRREAEHIYYLFTVQVENRDPIIEKLNRDGIGASIHFPIPLHEQPAFSNFGPFPNGLPKTHSISRRIFSLPLYPEMTDEQINKIILSMRTAVQEFC